MKRGIQRPLGKKFSELPDDFRQEAHRYFYKILPITCKEHKAVSQLGAETSLEAFEGLIEEGGIVLTRSKDWCGYNVLLFNLVTQQYEDITLLKEELEDINEDS